MKDEKVTFYLYRLVFESYLKMKPDDVDVRDLQEMTDQILSHVQDISFQDGNHEPTTTFGSASDGRIAYVTIERKVNHKMGKEKTREQRLVLDYPDFTLVLDGRNPQQEGILVGIEYNRKSFANIDTVRKGLEKYFREHVGKKFSYDVYLRQLSSSDRFWQQVEQKVKAGKPLQGLYLQITNFAQDQLFAKLPEKQSFFYSFYLEMGRKIGAQVGNLSFQSHEASGLDVEKAKTNLGTMIALACNYGFAVVARFDNKKISSDAAAPVTFELDRTYVVRPESEGRELEEANRAQWNVLTQTFDTMISKLKQIEEQKQHEQTRHIAKR